MLPVERVAELILVLRGQRVMLDADLARVYGVSTKRLNEQVKRNRARFPADFRFQLTANEKAQVVANCDHLQSLKFSRVRPYAFTEHGALMLASVLNSSVAVLSRGNAGEGAQLVEGGKPMAPKVAAGAWPNADG